MGVTPVDRFWAEAQLDLLDLPRPWVVLERLEKIKPEGSEDHFVHRSWDDIFEYQEEIPEADKDAEFIQSGFDAIGRPSALRTARA